MNEFQYDLFLSHSGADKAWVRQLATHIEQRFCQGRRLKVFLDKRDIQPGENWVTALQNALQVSHRIGIVLSPEALEAAWVQAELTAAMNMGLSTHQRRLIPLYFRDCDLPPFLAAIQYLDFRNPIRYEESLEKLVSILCEWPLPPRPAPSPLPIHPLTPQEQRQRIRDQFMRLTEEQIKDFLYFKLNQRWDDLPGSWKQSKIRELIQLYDSLGEEDYGVGWLLYQVEQYVKELRAGLELR